MALELTNFMFDNTLMPVTTQQYTLMRGVTDYTQLAQFDLYETGYSFLVMLKIPTFLDVMRSNEYYRALIDNYSHIIEYDFRGAQGIEDITSDPNNITNGIDQLQVITRVTEQSSTGFQMQYFERSGSVITKTHEAYLRGIKDPRTQIKRYNGILRQRFTGGPMSSGATAKYNKDAGENLMNDKGYQYEVFHFLLIVTDNTGLNLEKAYILASAQPNAASTNIYNVTKGEYNFSELSITYNAFPISGKIVNLKALHFLDWINEHTCFDEMDFAYNILSDSQLNIDNLNDRDYTSSAVLTNTDAVAEKKTSRITSSYTAPQTNRQTTQSGTGLFS